jgi:hypothetical protein
MSEKKEAKREVKGVWDRVKRLRAERAKIYAPAEIEASASELSRSAERLRELARQLSALNAMPPGDAPAEPAAPGDKPKKARGKAKKTASAKS